MALSAFASEVGLEVTQCMFGCLGLMDGVSVAESSKHKYYFYQTSTRSCNTTIYSAVQILPLSFDFNTKIVNINHLCLGG